MTRIILTRHGETLWNTQGRVQGAMDSSLTDKGEVQARKLGKRLTTEGITRLFSSDLPRAVSTARRIQEALKITPLHLCPELREFSFGDWEGKMWQELRDAHPEVFKTWERAPHQVQVPNGDTMQAVGERAWKFILQKTEEYPGEVLCFVTHGITLQLVVKKALGIPLEQWENVPWQYNTAVNILDIYKDGTVKPICLADCSHLDPIQY